MGEWLPDETLVGAFGRGDVSAFEAIVFRYRVDVATLANRLLGWPGDVDDITQEVFLAAYMNLKRFRGQSGLRTWLFASVNKCRSHTSLGHRLLQTATVAAAVQVDRSPWPED